MSLAIKELEEELGVTLLERTSRRIVLTKAGEDALRDARAVLAAADTMRRRARETSQGLMGSMSIGFISLPAYSFLPETLRRFGEDYPQVRLSLQEGTTDQIAHDIESGRLDIGLVFRTPDLPASLDSVLVRSEPLVVALPESHPLARNRRIALEKLAQERFLGFERHQGPLMFDAIVSTCMRHGFSPGCSRRGRCTPSSAWSLAVWAWRWCPPVCRPCTVKAWSTGPCWGKDGRGDGRRLAACR